MAVMVEDPLAGLKFVEADYAWVTRELMAVADTVQRTEPTTTAAGSVPRCATWEEVSARR